MPIFVLDEAVESGSVKMIDLEFNVLRQPVHVRIGYRDEDVRLSDIVPVARILSSRILQTKLSRLRMVGKSVPCHKGCDACCHTPVMVSVPEAMYLVEELRAKAPAGQFERYVEFCERAIRQVRDCLPMHATPRDLGDVSASEVSKFSDWYANSSLSCPFLRGGSCEIYSYRPTMCRECFVIGSASQCQIGKESAVVSTIPGPLQVGEVLMHLASEFTHAHREGILIHSVFSWYERSEKVWRQRWPAGLLVKRFSEIVRSKVSVGGIRERAPRGQLDGDRTAALR